ncbi:hypothetical protein HG15A2_00330 [Adhaeretor mobilis]|uniref:Uncharacterized protein n=1 Tax=Adhaeretor mobilis TaxID=1930276 RepID=A0A517MPG4_9BACT|nr:hypothetical protein HG15A2_00330 [Adhaeretor mobilis]
MTKTLSTLAAVTVLVATCEPTLAVERLSQPTTLSQDSAVEQATCTSCGCAAATCGCATEPCRVDPCKCHKARMKVAKCATCVCDPDCYQCESEIKKEEVEKHCYNVCAEPVCIPKFRWPWECCKKSCQSSCCDSCCGGCDCTACCDGNCTNKHCGKIRCVNNLEKEKYTCDVCVTEWKAVRKSCGCCNGGGCDGCSDGCCALNGKASNVATASAEEPVAKDRHGSTDEAGQESPLARLTRWLRR